MFPIKYIENNMILNQQGEWWAYYELIPYNYAFLSPDEKMAVHELSCISLFWAYQIIKRRA